MKVLVTGASGFIGSRLVRHLVERGDDVKVLIRPSSSRAGLAKLPVEIAEGDITVEHTVYRALAGCDRVFHVAAAYKMWDPNPASILQPAVEGTRCVLSAVRHRGDKIRIVDVREPNEYQINRIPGSVLLPLGEVPRRYAELDPEEDIVVQCKVGARSAKAADFLRSVGFKKVRNLKGGILDWIDKVDPSQPKY